MEVIPSLLLPLLLILTYHLRGATGRTDDAKEYLLLGEGGVAEGPFGRRWLLPFLLGGVEERWRWVNYVCITLTSLLLGLQWGWVASVLYLGCSSLSRIPLVIPALVDAPSFLLALAATMAPFPLNILLALLSGACKETGPVFAAAWSLNPLLLLGLLGVRWWHPRRPSDKPWLQSPLEVLKLSIPTHPWLSMHSMLFPWGALMVLVPVGLGLGVDWKAPVLSLLLGYSSLLLARDRARLYEWALPGILPAALACPPWLIYPLLLPHLMNPSTEV